MEVVMASIAGGLKISNDDDTYSYAYVSREAAALFGYTVEEFMEVTGGTAVGAVYPPDLEQALADCAEAFRDGGLSYSTRYRVRCRDGSLKWVIDSGKKALDGEGSWMVNSLYLDVTRAEEDAQRLREQTQLLTSIYDTCLLYTSHIISDVRSKVFEILFPLDKLVFLANILFGPPIPGLRFHHNPAATDQYLLYE